MRRDSRVRRYDRANGDRCILLALRLRDRVRWALGREREWHLRDQCGRVRGRGGGGPRAKVGQGLRPVVEAEHGLDPGGQIMGQVDSAGPAPKGSGRVLDPASECFIVALLGSEAEVAGFMRELARHAELIEVVRSGVLGIARSNPRLHVVK